jgi:hypothetical protein
MDHLDPVDEQTLRVIIQLQCEELDQFARANQPKGKGRAGEQDARADFLVAVEAYRNDLRRAAQSLADETMCKSISSALETDADLVAAAVSEEEQTMRDRALALQLSGPARSVFSVPVSDFPLVLSVHGRSSSACGMWPFFDADRCQSLLPQEPSVRSSASHAESSAWAQSRRHPVPSTQCIACAEWCAPCDLAKAPCRHEYCRDCLRALFRASLVDETLFPPKCCKQPFVLTSCHTLLTSDLITQYGDKEVEFRTPAAQRTYCHACSAFVPPQRVKGDVASCGRPDCGAQTCTFCRGGSHVGSDCPQGPARQDLERLAAAEGWQHCFGCKRIVELDTGCYHISEWDTTGATLPRPFLLLFLFLPLSFLPIPFDNFPSSQSRLGNLTYADDGFLF